MAEAGGESGDGVFGGGYGAEDLALAYGVGDVAAGAEPVHHGAHVFVDGHEWAKDGSDPVDVADRVRSDAYLFAE
jgi:hypothetical protein